MDTLAQERVHMPIEEPSYRPDQVRDIHAGIRLLRKRALRMQSEYPKTAEKRRKQASECWYAFCEGNIAKAERILGWRGIIINPAI